MYVQVTMNNRFESCRIVEHYEIAIPCFNVLQIKYKKPLSQSTI